MSAAEFRATLSPVIASPVLRRLLPAFTVSAIGDGMSAVGVAWLAIRIAPPADRDLVVGLAVAAYTLPGRPGPSPPAACYMRLTPQCPPPCSSGKAPRNCFPRSWPPAAR
jgi:hypothetical protein